MEHWQWRRRITRLQEDEGRLEAEAEEETEDVKVAEAMRPLTKIVLDADFFLELRVTEKAWHMCVVWWYWTH